MREVGSCEDRLKSLMIMDKSETPHKINKVLKSEILYLLNNYFNISSDDLFLDLNVNTDGEYVLEVVAKSRFLKVAQVID